MLSTLDPDRLAIAFAGTTFIARGSLAEVAPAAARFHDSHRELPSPLVLDAETSEPVEVDLRGSDAEVLARLTPAGAAASGIASAASPEPARRTPGRPKLGVVAREVTLLPRHWEWLAEQPGGASVTLRKLVEAARRDDDGAARARRAQEATYRLLFAVAGDRPGYESALRALYAGDAAGFSAAIAEWPSELAEHALALSAPAFPEAD